MLARLNVLDRGDPMAEFCVERRLRCQSVAKRAGESVPCGAILADLTLRGAS